MSFAKREHLCILAVLNCCFLKLICLLKSIFFLCRIVSAWCKVGDILLFNSLTCEIGIIQRPERPDLFNWEQKQFREFLTNVRTKALIFRQAEIMLLFNKKLSFTTQFVSRGDPKRFVFYGDPSLIIVDGEFNVHSKRYVWLCNQRQSFRQQTSYRFPPRRGGSALWPRVECDGPMALTCSKMLVHLLCFSL